MVALVFSDVNPPRVFHRVTAVALSFGTVVVPRG